MFILAINNIIQVQRKASRPPESSQYRMSASYCCATNRPGWATSRASCVVNRSRAKAPRPNDARSNMKRSVYPGRKSQRSDLVLGGLFSLWKPREIVRTKLKRFRLSTPSQALPDAYIGVARPLKGQFAALSLPIEVTLNPGIWRIQALLRSRYAATGSLFGS